MEGGDEECDIRVSLSAKYIVSKIVSVLIFKSRNSVVIGAVGALLIIISTIVVTSGLEDRMLRKKEEEEEERK